MINGQKSATSFFGISSITLIVLDHCAPSREYYEHEQHTDSNIYKHYIYNLVRPTVLSFVETVKCY